MKRIVLILCSYHEPPSRTPLPHPMLMSYHNHVESLSSEALYTHCSHHHAPCHCYIRHGGATVLSHQLPGVNIALILLRHEEWDRGRFGRAPTGIPWRATGELKVGGAGLRLVSGAGTTPTAGGPGRELPPGIPGTYRGFTLGREENPRNAGKCPPNEVSGGEECIKGGLMGAGRVDCLWNSLIMVEQGIEPCHTGGHHRPTDGWATPGKAEGAGRTPRPPGIRWEMKARHHKTSHV